MATSQITRLENGTITLSITIPAERIKKALSEEVEKAVSQANVPGFRKGKAPRNLVEGRVDQEKAKEEVLRKLLPEYYLEAIKEHDVKPVVTPKIHVGKIEDDKDWQ